MSPTRPEDIGIVAYNREKWDAQVVRGNRWTVPVASEVIAEARAGKVSIVLTPSKPIPAEWLPDLSGCKLLCLASGGGQQAPVLAAAGAEVTVFDNSPRQLGQDQAVAEREGLSLKTVQGDMADLSCFADETFDLIVHPCSNTFVPDIKPVWREAYRVLRTGGALLSGFCNPLMFLFDDDLLEEKGEFKVRHRIPYSDLTSITEEERARYAEQDEPICFGHTLEDQIGGQTEAGFAITGFYEDDRGADSDDVLSKFIKSFGATRSVKLA